MPPSKSTCTYRASSWNGSVHSQILVTAVLSPGVWLGKITVFTLLIRSVSLWGVGPVAVGGHSLRLAPPSVDLQLLYLSLFSARCLSETGTSPLFMDITPIFTISSPPLLPVHYKISLILVLSCFWQSFLDSGAPLPVQTHSRCILVLVMEYFTYVVL